MPLSDLIEHLINAKLNLVLERSKVPPNYEATQKAERAVQDAKIYIDRKYQQTLQSILTLEAQMKKLMEKVQQLEHKPIQKVPKAEQVPAKRQGKLTVAIGVLRPNHLVKYIHNKLHRWYDDDPEPCLGMLPDESVIHSGLITVPSDWIEPGLEYCRDEQDKSTETT